MKYLIPVAILLVAVCLLLINRPNRELLSVEPTGSRKEGETRIGAGDSGKTLTKDSSSKSSAMNKTRSLERPHTENMSVYFDEIRGLIESGEFAEALRRHIWFHENALEYDEGMYGVRLSFALGSWFSLGEEYQPAMDAFLRIRDEDAAILSRGQGDEHLFHDLLSFNETLGEKQKSIEVFEKLQGASPAIAKEYWRFIKDTVLESERYDIAAKYIAEPSSEFEQVVNNYDENSSLYEDPRIGGEHFRNYNENNFVKQALALIDLASALGNESSAEEIRSKAFSLLEDPRLAGPAPNP